MTTTRLTIDGRAVEAPAGNTILEAARRIGVYIPTLCHHPDLPPAEGCAASAAVYAGGRRVENARPGEPGKGCGLCAVEIEGRAGLAAACSTFAAPGMRVATASAAAQAARRERLAAILSAHPHACLTCAQQEGCSRSQCPANVPENERCCALFAQCELRRVALYVGIAPSTPRWVPRGTAAVSDSPLFTRDERLCIGCTRCVRACRDLRGIEALGFVADGDGKVRVGTLAGTLALSGCRFCTACVAVCPTGALADKGAGARARGEDLVPCRGACPAGIDVPEYVRRLAEGRRDEAVAVIREKVPFPGVLGRICTRPCETACRRGPVDAPVAICALKRFAADGDTGLWRRALRPRPETGRKVAVVGAGPAGLTAAFHLRRQGHAVTVFEKSERAGGMLRCGVPAYRLPREVLDAEVQAVWDTGVEFRPGQALGRDFTLDGLLSGGFDAVFLAVGAQQGRPVAIDGADLPGVLQGLDFLRRVAGGEEIRLAGRVVVIGGGNTAVDAARTARRCGAAEVFLACLEAPEEMPAGPREIEAAVAEGVRILPSRGPGRILCRDGRAAALDLVECTGVLDARGNFCPRFGERRECLPVDAIILAVGQAVEPGWAEAGGSIRMSGGRVAAEAGSGATGRPGVFAGGDVAAASGAAIDAIAAGRRAAAAIDRSLGGRGDIDEVFFERGAPSPRIGRDEGFAFRPREAEAEREPSERVGGFREVSLGLTAGQARREARRCLQCDLRLWIRPSPPPPENLLPFDAGHIGRVPETEGVFRLLDAGRNVLSIRGAADLRRALLEALEGGAAAEWFGYEEDKMYTRRESELLQDYVQRHGRMPGGGGEDLEDLY